MWWLYCNDLCHLSVDFSALGGIYHWKIRHLVVFVRKNKALSEDAVIFQTLQAMFSVS
jgi:hypothetical protein